MRCDAMASRCKRGCRRSGGQKPGPVDRITPSSQCKCTGCPNRPINAADHLHGHPRGLGKPGSAANQTSAVPGAPQSREGLSGPPSHAGGVASGSAALGAAQPAAAARPGSGGGRGRAGGKVEPLLRCVALSTGSLAGPRSMQSLQLVQICNSMQASPRGRRPRQQGGPRRRRRRRRHAAPRPLPSGQPRRRRPHRSRPLPLPSALLLSSTHRRLSTTALRAPSSPRMHPSCPAASGCWAWCPASSSEWWVCPLTTANPSSPCCKKVRGSWSLSGRGVGRPN